MLAEKEEENIFNKKAATTAKVDTHKIMKHAIQTLKSGHFS